jgi:hypothetical protein
LRGIVELHDRDIVHIGNVCQCFPFESIIWS